MEPLSQLCQCPGIWNAARGNRYKESDCTGAGERSHILKYVNPEFKETQKKNHKKKLEDPNKLNEKAEAEEYIRMIVTDARVMKCYHKLVDNGILPEKFELKHMKHVAQNLPKAVYEDCVKEELEILKKAGEFGGKLCSKVTMEIIKDKLKIG